MQEMLRKYGKVSNYEKALQHSVDCWRQRLSVVQVKTPSHSMDTILNHWVLYQAWACRVWGRSGFYQSSGAFGFRDQLQDVMALVYSDPKIARHQIVLSASRQFKEGDVQHWWHPYAPSLPFFLFSFLGPNTCVDTMDRVFGRVSPMTWYGCPSW